MNAFLMYFIFFSRDLRSLVRGSRYLATLIADGPNSSP